MARTRIKICGIRDAETALFAVESGADALGFVFAKTSPRYIEPVDAWEILQMLPPFVTSVGLTVNLKSEQFDEIQEAAPFDLVQLHGSESIPQARDYMTPVIKAIRFDEATISEELGRWARVDEVVAILVDGSAGGEGESFDWEKLAALRDEVVHPLILAGGLTPENVGEAIRIVRPYAVDVSSGVESERGTKDPARIRAFCAAVRAADGAG
ncbi:MAG: phosphoribosylanthranilate isomerase [Phycisphaerales bacterium]|nr:phosphoribosylanthranilate isomerase [Phycisphaerales bacterium]